MRCKNIGQVFHKSLAKRSVMLENEITRDLAQKNHEMRCASKDYGV